MTTKPKSCGPRISNPRSSRACLTTAFLAFLIPSTVLATVLEFADGDLAAINGIAQGQVSTQKTTSAPRAGSAVRADWRAVARTAAARHGIPTDLFLKLVDQESRWKVNALSPKGAFGLAQLMPATARQLGVDRDDPAQNLEGGARYLAQQYALFGTWPLALAAYNAGPEAVQKYGAIPPYRETEGYVSAILGSEIARREPRVRTSRSERADRSSVMEFTQTGDD